MVSHGRIGGMETTPKQAPPGRHEARQRESAPAPLPEPQARRPHVPVTPERRQLYLDALARVGIRRIAARMVASPESLAMGRDAEATWRSLEKIDPLFASEVSAALEEANDKLEEEAWRRGYEGTLEPIYQKAERLYDETGKPAFIRRYSDNLLLRLLERRRPGDWSQHRKVEHSGAIDHGASDRLSLGPADLVCLSREERRGLASILEKIYAHRRGVTPQPIALERGDVVDAEFTERHPGDPYSLVELERVNG